MIFSDATIVRFAQEAENLIAKEVRCIGDRISLDIIAGVSVYTLPSYVLDIRRILWKGHRLTPLNLLEREQLYSANLTVTGGEPQRNPEYYEYNNIKQQSVRFYPTPGTTIASTVSNLYDIEVPNRVIVDCWRLPDFTGIIHRIPSWARRRIVKHYTNAKGFGQEGKGCDPEAAEYHMKRFETMLQRFRLVWTHHFLARQTQFAPQNVVSIGPARPVLPSNFGVIVR